MPYLTSHTATSEFLSHSFKGPANYVFDVLELIKLTRKNPIYTIPIDRLRGHFDQQKSTGFSEARLKKASLLYPLICFRHRVSTLATCGVKYELLDGRHRLIKAQRLGKRFVRIRIAEVWQICMSFVPENEITRIRKES